MNSFKCTEQPAVGLGFVAGEPSAISWASEDLPLPAKRLIGWHLKRNNCELQVPLFPTISTLIVPIASGFVPKVVDWKKGDNISNQALLVFMVFSWQGAGNKVRSVLIKDLQGFCYSDLKRAASNENARPTLAVATVINVNEQYDSTQRISLYLHTTQN